ncbi:MAG: galactose mutarotase [Clostridiales bacterium]|nr:galactose mutarotase [Clostridiales bacterium]
MITKRIFGQTKNGEKVDLFTMSNTQGTEVDIITFGATVQSIRTKDKNGVSGDILIGFDTMEGHENYSANQGMTIGRYANRISGSFTLDGVKYELSKNEKGITNLHSDGEASQRVWSAIIADDNRLEMSLKSPDMTSGFPGNIDMTVTFTLFEDNSLRIDYYAKADKATPINMTNHAYFNLGGSEDILDTVLTINADSFTPTDENSIPTGEIRSVEGTAFDFRKPKKIGRDISENDPQLVMCGGYDHNFCLNEGDGAVITAFDEKSGRVLEVFTDMPGCQLYTGNFLDGTAPGKGGVKMQKHAGFCLETQFYPDTPNNPSFPQCTFAAGKAFESTTVYRFSVKNG